MSYLRDCSLVSEKNADAPDRIEPETSWSTAERITSRPSRPLWKKKYVYAYIGAKKSLNKYLSIIRVD